jgi:ABC-type bacteriocin/lantibiotic exporter with double-glycine peptidase domain
VPTLKRFIFQWPIYRAIGLLDKKSRAFLALLGLAQVFLSVLDLIGVALVGAILVLATLGESSSMDFNFLKPIYIALQIDSTPIRESITRLALVAVTILTLRTLISITLIKTSFKFLSYKSTEISTHLISQYLKLNILDSRRISSQEAAYAMTTGVDKLTVGILGTSISLVSDVSVALVLFVALLNVNLSMTLGLFLYFIIIGSAIYFVSGKQGKRISTRLTQGNILISEIIVEASANFRDLIIRNRAPHYTELVYTNRLRLQKQNAIMAFLPYTGKYIFESSLIIGGVLMSVVAFQTLTTSEALSLVSLFLASSIRIAPAILRVQQGLLTIALSSGLANKTLELSDYLSLKDSASCKSRKISLDLPTEGFSPTIVVEGVTFNYNDQDVFSISVPNLVIEAGQVIAIVGPSGSGKSTLADLLLGILLPTRGEIRISGIKSDFVHEAFPGAMGYVPQRVYISDTSLKNNITLGFDEVSDSNKDLLRCVERAHLSEFIRTLPGGLDSQVGEWGGQISGGQSQRVGIARALYTSPKLLVLDEATSALDSETESTISKNIDALRGEVTVIIIAHRLATIRNADLILYMSEGQILAQGSFEEIRNEIAEFDKQAILLGL